MKRALILTVLLVISCVFLFTSCSSDECDHSETVVTREDKTDATCAVGGTYDEVTSCKLCEAELERKSGSTDPLSHDEVSHEAKAPTCTEIGYGAYVTCTRCDYTTYLEIPALGHTEAVDEAVAPTCTEAGKTAGTHCADCNEILVAQQTVAALGHDEVSHEAKAPTCTEIGYGAYVTCTRCDYTTYEEVAALGHDEVSHEAKTPTCTEIGYGAYVTCTRCDYTTYLEIPALGHTEAVDEAVVPTCTEAGKTAGTHCAVCGETLVAQETLAALGHDIKIDVGVDPTCTESGLTSGSYCLRCNTVFTHQMTIPAFGHEYDDKYDPTCNVCGDVREAECAHNAIEVIMGYAATCLAAGATDGERCLDCGEVLTASEVIPALGHNLTSHDGTAPTCTASGYTPYVECSRCDYTTYQSLNATGHTEVIDKAVAPGCVSTGLTEGVRCSVCDTVITEQTVVAALGHTSAPAVKENEVKATCTVGGSFDEVIYCSVCSKELSRETKTTPEDDHSYVNKVCSVCGDVEGVSCPGYDNVHWFSILGLTSETAKEYEIKTVPPACDKEFGYTLYRCPECNKIFYENRVDSNPNDHKPAAAVKENEVKATCTVGGSYDEVVYCSVCSKELSRTKKYTASVDHVYVNGSCSGCGAAEPGVYSEGLLYTAIDDKTCYVSGLGDCTDENIVIPPISPDGLTVVAIGANAFYFKNIKSIVIPSSVTSIGDEAFKLCTSLEVVVLCEGLSTIGSGAFYGCVELISFDFPSTLVEIGDDAFNCCSALTEIVIPDSVKYIGSSAFANSNITVCYVGSGVETIGSGVFAGCGSLTAITVSANNSYYTSVDGNLFNKNCTVLVQYAIGKTDTTFVIPGTVTTIGKSAFSGDKDLVSITIPSSVTTINARAFMLCSGLVSVEIPDSVTYVGSEVFYGCTSLTEVTVPGSLETTATFMFGYCQSLKKVTISLGVKVIANSTFSNCTALETVIIPDSVTTISYKAFYLCSALTSVRYHGTDTDWAKITVESDNTALDDAVFEFDHSHTYGAAVRENIVPAGCTVWGSYVEVVCCTECSEELTRTDKVLSALGHNYSGTRCTVCGTYKDGDVFVKCDKDGTPSENGQYILFGEYPQSIKADNVTITSTRDGRGYYLGSDGFYYAAVTASPDIANAFFTTNIMVVSGTVYYFKVEPIRWRILTENGTHVFLMCDSIISGMAYQSNYAYMDGKYYTTANGAPKGTYANNYEYSDVRRWLNDNFYATAFTELEKEMILFTTVDNSESSTASSPNSCVCADTVDKIFLPSYKEVNSSEYGFIANPSDYYDDGGRGLVSSDYSRALGVGTCFDSFPESYYGKGIWWLRSPSYSSLSAGTVGCGGYTLGTDSVYRDRNGIVPAMWIDLGEVEHTHTPADAVKENQKSATCTEGGSYDEVVYCSECGEELSRTSNSTPAVGHDYENGNCTICGEKDPSANGDPLYVRDGNYIYFGEYPQTIKADDVIITSTQDNRGYYLGSDGYYYAAVTATPYKASFKFTNNATIVSGEVYYFKVEPIRWRILEEKNEEAFLLCDFIIANRAYDSVNNNYKDSDIRAWLNAEFYNTAFTKLEKEIILITNVDNSVSSTDKVSNSYACENTYDKVFLLSYQEAINSAYGFSSNAGTYDAARMMQTSDYSRAVGANMVINDVSNYGIGYWWLRSPYYNNSNYAYGILSGYLYFEVGVGNSHYSVVPAIKISLNGVAHTHTPANSVKENQKSATCTEGGSYDEVIYCSECGEELSRSEKSTPALGHNYENGNCTICGERDPDASLAYVREGDYIYFGEYPQTIKSDFVTVDLSQTDSRGYYLGSDGYYYAAVTAAPYGGSCTFTNNVIAVSGAVYYFKVEPIKWRILSEENGEAFLFCDLIIDRMAYQPSYRMDFEVRECYTTANGAPDGTYASNYRYSEIRKWLNDNFYNTAFTELQKGIILTTHVDFSANGIDSTDGIAGYTEDKVFLLSKEEATNSAYGFSAGILNEDVARMMNTSDYSRARGIETYAKSGAYYGNWWLRSHDQYDSYAASCISYYGDANYSVSISAVEFGVVPAIRIKL